MYSSLKASPPRDAGKLCKCMNDVDNNGIVEGLGMVANYFKNFGKAKKTKKGGWWFNDYSLFKVYNFGTYQAFEGEVLSFLFTAINIIGTH